MRVGFTLVDVFTDVPFAGNQLCVVPEPPDDLGSATMQVLAREIGFSETTYVTAVREGGYDVRIFTPVSELPFAGHPTLGTAFTLARLGVVPSRIVQTTMAGDVPVEVELEAGTATMRQLPPLFGGPFDDREAIASAVGLDPDDLGAGPIVPVSTGISHLMVPIVGRSPCAAHRETIGAARTSASGQGSNPCTCSPSEAVATSWHGCSTARPRSVRTRPPDRPPVHSAPTSPNTAEPACPGAFRSPRANRSGVRPSSKSRSSGTTRGGSRSSVEVCGPLAQGGSTFRRSSRCTTSSARSPCRSRRFARGR